MNENDKILIHAYLDGETSESESSYIEALLSSDKLANEYANDLKKANNEISNFFDQSDFKELEVDISRFTDSLKSADKTSEIFNGIFKIFKSQQVLGYALTAIIFFSGGIFIEFENSTFETPSEIVNNIPVNRGDRSDNRINEEIKKTIYQMIQQNILQGRLTYESSSLIIFLDDKVLSEAEYFCYSGSIFFSNSDQSEILYCSSKNDSTLTYIN